MLHKEPLRIRLETFRLGNDLFPFMTKLIFTTWNLLNNKSNVHLQLRDINDHIRVRMYVCLLIYWRTVLPLVIMQHSRVFSFNSVPTRFSNLCLASVFLLPLLPTTFYVLIMDNNSNYGAMKFEHKSSETLKCKKKKKFI